MPDKNFAKSVSLSLHHSFCLNREPKVKKLLNPPRNLQEQKEGMRAYGQLKAWERIVISSDDEEEFIGQITQYFKGNGKELGRVLWASS